MECPICFAERSVDQLWRCSSCPRMHCQECQYRLRESVSGCAYCETPEAPSFDALREDWDEVSHAYTLSVLIDGFAPNRHAYFQELNTRILARHPSDLEDLAREIAQFRRAFQL